MGDHVNEHESKKSLLDATCRVALAGLLHDLGKLAERADMPLPNREILDVNKQLYCPNPKPHPGSPGWFTHVHAAYTALALDAIEPDLPPIKGEDASPFQEWGAAQAGGADDSLINAAAKHHKPDTFLQWVVATADRAASGLDRERFDEYNNARDEDPTSGKNHYTARQYTLFEQIDIGQGESGSGERAAPTWDYRYRLDPLSPRSIFPVRAEGYERNDRAAARAEYADLWNGFRKALARIPRSHRRNLPLWLDHFDSLWMTFTHSVPAATAFGTIPDVSLYDHSRVVAALAAAIWRYHHERDDGPGEVRARLAVRRDWGEPKLLFVQGDLSGIQDFVFATGGQTTKHAAKLLRGRSFYVTLLTECAALRVLDALALPPTSQILNAAGKFQIVAPNTDHTVEKLREVRRALDEWFLRHTFGQSGIGIAWTPAACNDLRQGSRNDSPYRALITRLFEALEDAKLRRFGLCGGSAPSPVFEGYLESIGEHGRLCAVDGRSPADGKGAGSEGLGRLACDQITIGSLLTRNDRNRLLVTRSPLDGPNVDSLDTDIFGYRIGFTGDEEASGRFGDDAAAGNLVRAWDFSLPEPEDAETPLFHGYARRDINAWVPRFNGADLADRSRYEGLPDDDSDAPEVDSIKTFNQLAREAWQPRQPDNGSDSEREAWLGTAALMTLKGDVDDLGAIFQHGLCAPSLSRMATLSRQMNAFFAIHLPYLCRTEFRNTYTVFAGGDDFFLIGPWTDQMDLASRLRSDFHRYVAGNARVGFSAGLAMTKPGLPVRRIGAMGDEALDESKGHRLENTGPKNAVTCFGRTVDWKIFDGLLDARKRIAELADQSVPSRGYFYGLLELVDLFEGLARRPENSIWRSRFHYRTWRALERIRGLDLEERRALMGTLAKELSEGGIERFKGDYRIALSAHLYRNRT